ncbi:tetratricopeptide repeat protein [Caldimonas brevitalea]|uniref:Uncharacterized protein n=1 Tax=Caldimonas brevitalea TaxID=413882 RepID=A0A0G3BFL9_9BURK|nr:tetratricopeptide repeat protein [Caldimonas brevitalea]AKJ28239.1 hypothetical protein AAW51_1548 [Caldimonas brevitalea]
MYNSTVSAFRTVSQPRLLALSALSAFTFACAFALSPLPTHAADTGGSSSTAAPAADADMAAGRKAVQDKRWAEAVTHLRKVVERDPNNADAHNLLGYSYRWQNRMDESFAHYGKALAIDPQHRGAHEYVGVAYLKVGNPAKAEEHLAKLQQICGSNCEETRSLAAKVAEYQAAKR